MPALTLLVALLFVVTSTPIRRVSEILADDSASGPCTDRPAQMSLHAFVDQFASYADVGESNEPTAGESASTASSSDQQATLNSSAVERGVGLLPGIIASLERRFKAAAMSSNNRRQPTADGRSMLSRLADVLARYGLRLPSGLLQASSLHPNDICSRVNADRMKHYCNGLPDGDYYDPWNPWCGYIECRGNKSVRRTCPAGRWMGVPGSSDGTMTQIDMCRTPLPPSSVAGRSSTSCAETTMMRDLCRQAEGANSVTPHVDPAEDLQSSLSELFQNRDDDQVDKTRKRR